MSPTAGDGLAVVAGVASYTFEPTVGLLRKSTAYGLNGRRPTLRVGVLILDRIPRSCSCGLFPWVALLSAKKYGTPHFSVRKRTSKYSRSLAELLCF